MAGRIRAVRLRVLPTLLVVSIAWSALMEMIVFNVFMDDDHSSKGASSSFGTSSIASFDRGLTLSSERQQVPPQSLRAQAGHHDRLSSAGSKARANQRLHGSGSSEESASIEAPGRPVVVSQIGGLTTTAQRQQPQPNAKLRHVFKQFELESDVKHDDDGGTFDSKHGAAAPSGDNGPEADETKVGSEKGDDVDPGDADEDGDDESYGDGTHDDSKALEAGDDPIGGGAIHEATVTEVAMKMAAREHHDLMAHERSSNRDSKDGSLMLDAIDDDSEKERDDDRVPKERETTPKEPGRWPHFKFNWTSQSITSRSNVSLQVAHAPSQVVSILVLPQIPDRKRRANARHLIYDGIQQSQYLNFTEDVTNTAGNVVWLLDLHAAREFWAPKEDETLWCPVLETLIRDVQKVRIARKQPAVWPIAIVDNRDFPIISSCKEIGDALGDQNVRYSYRSAVQHRTWNASVPWVNTGILLGRDVFPQPKVYEYRQRPIGVRTDTVKAVEGLLNETYGMKLCHPIEEVNRTVDISYFWELVNFTRKDSNLRDHVYRILRNMQRDRPDLNMMVGVRGVTAMAGRRKVSNVYIETLLQSKIVVVTQRDHWEDQYRLFEAIVSGAMVMTDEMLSLPRGLVDGESVVEYRGADDLRGKLNYYLSHSDERISIAKRGRRAAMSNHRSWLHMEEMVFGSPVTVCSDATGSACPFVVHAHQVNETC